MHDNVDAHDCIPEGDRQALQSWAFLLATRAAPREAIITFQAKSRMAQARKLSFSSKNYTNNYILKGHPPIF